jgi:signal transduction histidine kinase
LQVDESTQHLLSILTGIIIPLAIPITITFSILRYRLCQVDVWINRTLVYGTLTALVVSAYVLVVGVVSRAFASRDSDFAAFLALLMVMLLIVPLHRWLQTHITRWLPPSPQQTLSPAASHAAPPSLPLRMAQWGWLALFVILLWQIVTLLANWQRIVQIAQHEWIVESGYALVARWVSVKGYTTYLLLLDQAISLVFLGLASFIFWKRRQDWLALYAATTLLLVPFTVGIGSTALGEGLGLMGLPMLVVLFFIFPDGHFIPHSWRNRALLLLALVATPFVLFPLLRGLLGEQNDVEWLGYVTVMLTMGITMTAGVGSQISRYRREPDPSRRQQTKWVLYGFGLQLVWIGWFVFWLLFQRWLSLEEPFFALVMIHLIMVMPLAFALTLAFSILRYRLWEIDVLVQRTAVYGTLTALIIFIYIMLVGGLGELLRGESVWLAVITTGVVALAIQPVRQRLQTAVNRLMYGERDDPITVLTTLGRRLEETAVPAETLPALVETVAQTLKLPYVAILGAGEQGSGGAGEILAAYPTPLVPHSSPLTLPLVYQSETIGQLLVSPRAPGETFNPAEMRLLQNVARQAGTAVYAAQLTHDLQRSRERLVTTREEERRRIHRDLHDGLGPQLATLSLKVDAARNHLAQNTETADQRPVDHLLIELKSDIQNAISDIRRLVHDLRPLALDQLGLVSALQEYVARQNGNSHLQITIYAPDTLPLLPAAVEVGAYRIALEAITNTMRHARAQTCHIHLRLADGFHLEIRDDGVGLPVDYQAGIGLSSMRERTTELGGTFHIESTPGDGTSISVQLPFSRDP